MTVLTFTANTTWTIPSDWNPFNHQIQCGQGGASGSPGSSGTGASYGNGGAGGPGGNEVSSNNILNLSPGTNVVIIVGLGGIGGSPYSQSGNPSWVYSNTTIYAASNSSLSVGQNFVSGSPGSPGTNGTDSTRGIGGSGGGGALGIGGEGGGGPSGTGGGGAVIITYQPITAPLLLYLSNNQGVDTGGTTVGITGNSFVNISNVNFGTIPASSFSVVNATYMTAVSPPDYIDSLINIIAINNLGNSNGLSFEFLHDNFSPMFMAFAFN